MCDQIALEIRCFSSSIPTRIRDAQPPKLELPSSARCSTRRPKDWLRPRSRDQLNRDCLLSPANERFAPIPNRSREFLLTTPTERRSPSASRFPTPPPRSCPFSCLCRQFVQTSLPSLALRGRLDRARQPSSTKALIAVTANDSAPCRSLYSSRV